MRYQGVEPIREFLMEHGENEEIVDPAIEAIRPLVEEVGTGKISLTNGYLVPFDELKNAFGKVILDKVDILTPVSVYCPFHKPGFMPEDIYWDALGRSFKTSFREKMNAKYPGLARGIINGKKTSSDLIHDFGLVLWDSFIYELEQAIYGMWRETCGPVIVHKVAANIRAIIYYYLDLVLFNDPRRDDFVQLISFLPPDGIIPLAKRLDCPGSVFTFLAK